MRRLVFEALARRRPAHGVEAAGELVVRRGGELLPEGAWPVRARLAKATGVPEGFSDILTIATRISLPGSPRDVLFVTVGPFGRAVPVPARGWCEAVYSSLTPYGARWLLVQAAAGQPRVDASLRAARRLIRGGGFSLVAAVAPGVGVPAPIGELTLREIRQDALTGFDPRR